MFSKFLSALAFGFLVAGTSAAPTANTVARQEGFIFAASTIGPVTAEAIEQDAVETPAVVPSPGPSPEPVTAVAETPAAEPVPGPATDDEPMTSPETDFTFAYNVGGAAAGDFMDDPEDWVIGETAIFEIPDAVVEGAPEDYASIYRSHRYGLVGSTWGYDIAVETPGMYDCSLHYSEIYSEFFTEEPNRTFKVEISGDGAEEVQEAEFDVMVELKGAEFTPYIRTFTGIAIVNTLKIRETPSIGDAFLSGISCTYKSPLVMA